MVRGVHSLQLQSILTYRIEGAETHEGKCGRSSSSAAGLAALVRFLGTAIAVTLGAQLLAIVLHLLLHAADVDLLQGQLHFYHDFAIAPAPTFGRDSIEGEPLGEEFGGIRESLGALLQALQSISVVDAPLLGIGQHFVGEGYFFKLVARIGILVWMELFCQFSVVLLVKR